MRYDLVIKTANDLKKQGKYLQADILINKYLKTASPLEEGSVLTGTPQESIAEIKKILSLPNEERYTSSSLIKFRRLIKDLIDQANFGIEDDSIKSDLNKFASPIINSLERVIETAMEMKNVKADDKEIQQFIKTRTFGNRHFKEDFLKLFKFVSTNLYSHFE